MRESRSDTNRAISESRSRTAKVSGSFVKPSARLMPWPLQQVQSHLLRFRNSPLKSGSFSLGSKLMGQINLVQEAIPFINEKGSFTLVSGVLNEEPIFAGVAGATVSGALEGFVRATAIELPKGLRINVVSPTILKESEAQFGPFFPGVIPVEGWRVAQAYKRAILEVQTGQVYKVD